eukprot:364159-Chlamydomonas_euryale.AAC.1
MVRASPPPFKTLPAPADPGLAVVPFPPVLKDHGGNRGRQLGAVRKFSPLDPAATPRIRPVRCAAGKQLPEGLMSEVKGAVLLIQDDMHETFGSPENPLLFSVRSGAALSMPGMMDTVLNLGLNDTIVLGLAKQHGERFAYDCYRRLLQMFGDVVLGMPHHDFEERLTALKAKKGVKLDIELDAEDLKFLIQEYKDVYERLGQVLPQDPWEQLRMGIDAVFRSWKTPRAVKYRSLHKITGLKGTAVNVQAMVFGNRTVEDSGTGVCFTRNPATGERELFGEFLFNAQGEDMVAGIRTPLPVSELETRMPAIYKELLDITTKLELDMKDMQDCEFTVQEGRLFMLQTRNGKRTGAAALKIAVDMVKEGILTEKEAVLIVEPRHLDQLLHPTFVDESAYKKDVLATGLAASPGAAIGRVVFNAEDAEEWHARGEKVILCRIETSPEDVGGMHAAEGICTSRGGMTSHAAVVARGWGKPCVCGCEALRVDYKLQQVTIDRKDGIPVVVKEGEWLSLNGTTGEIILGQQPVEDPALVGDLATLMSWVDKYRRLQVWTNADTPEDAKVARANGAQGIGLTRTEHMFFSTPQRIAAVRRMIAAVELHSPAEADALKELEQYQREDFEGIFHAMYGLPVTIRLLDPPLHEFLPHEGPALSNLCQQIAAELGVEPDVVHARLEGLSESNPMMGLRGCRLGIVHPGITEMQASAIFNAAANVIKSGVSVHPKLMVPLVGVYDELQNQVDILRKVADRVQKDKGVKIRYQVGTMIEVPRGALQAGKLAEIAEFFSFGTNDLTQMTFGISRDDAQAKFLTQYVSSGILSRDPFDTIDVDGVGEMVRLAVKRGRETRPDIELGICGEHGGDPASIAFFEKMGLDYV